MHIKQLIITAELLENGGEQLFHCLTHLMQAGYFLGYFPKRWKKENRIYLKTQHKEFCHLENSYCSTSLSNILGKIYERIIFEEATTILKEITFSKEKTYMRIKKPKMPHMLCCL